MFRGEKLVEFENGIVMDLNNPFKFYKGGGKKGGSAPVAPPPVTPAPPIEEAGLDIEDEKKKKKKSSTSKDKLKVSLDDAVPKSSSKVGENKGSKKKVGLKV